MEYSQELTFTEKLLSKLQIKMKYISSDFSKYNYNFNKVNLRDILHYNENNLHIWESLTKRCRPAMIYHIETPLFFHFFLFELPDTDPPIYAYVGPYLTQEISQSKLLELAAKYTLNPNDFSQLELFYHDLPLLPDDSMLLTILCTLGEALWGNIDNFSVQLTEPSFSRHEENPISFHNTQTQEEALLHMQILERRYEFEAQLMHAVSAGQVHKAELCFSQLIAKSVEQRTPDPIRNLKNYAVILNTILRIAAQRGSVHPIHINEISTKYAKKIEMCVSEAACNNTIREMIRKYCILVKNHSLKGYSLLVRKVITRIDADLTADLSLKAQAAALNINPSYLSTLFKKETGVTLTEYVNKKRIDHALLLLNSTNMQIQMVAQYCGFLDVNYFTKTFKKIIGKTPKEYRKMLSV